MLHEPVGLVRRCLVDGAMPQFPNFDSYHMVQLHKWSHPNTSRYNTPASHVISPLRQNLRSIICLSPFQLNICLLKDYGSLHFCFLNEMYVLFNFCFWRRTCLVQKSLKIISNLIWKSLRSYLRVKCSMGKKIWNTLKVFCCFLLQRFLYW